MAHAVHARLNALDADLPASATARGGASAASPSGISIAVHDDLAGIERDWRAFEAQADGTVFQSVEYLSTWQRHVGQRDGSRPAVIALEGTVSGPAGDGGGAKTSAVLVAATLLTAGEDDPTRGLAPERIRRRCSRCCLRSCCRERCRLLSWRCS